MKIDNANLWKEGKYIDLWTIPHILAGVVLCGFFNLFGIEFYLNLILSTLIMIGWEFFELYVLDVHEYITNKVTDVVTGVIGFFFTYELILKFSIKTMFPWIVAVTMIWLLLNYWGFKAHKTRVDSKNIVS